MDPDALEEPKEVDPKYLSSQERFRMLVADYPIVLELKERLKLQLKF